MIYSVLYIICLFISYIMSETSVCIMCGVPFSSLRHMSPLPILAILFPKTLKLFGFAIIWLWAYLVKVWGLNWICTFFYLYSAVVWGHTFKKIFKKNKNLILIYNTFAHFLWCWINYLPAIITFAKVMFPGYPSFIPDVEIPKTYRTFWD